MSTTTIHLPVLGSEHTNSEKDVTDTYIQPVDTQATTAQEPDGSDCVRPSGLSFRESPARGTVTEEPRATSEKWSNAHELSTEGDFVTLPTGDRQKGDRLQCLQKWEGFVLEVLEDSFIARLSSLTDEEEDEEAEIFLSEVSDDDREYVLEGYVFYWTIGYLTKNTGQKLRISEVRFRRLPVWDEGDLEIVEREARELGQALR